MNKKVLISLVAASVIGLGSVPLITGNAIKSELQENVKEISSKSISGVSITLSEPGGYMNTSANGEVIIKDGILFLSFLVDNIPNLELKQRLNKLISTMDYRAKRNISDVINGAKIKFDINIDNFSGNTQLKGNLVKLSDEIMSELKRNASRKDSAKQLLAFIEDGKLGFELLGDTLKINDINEKFSDNRVTTNFLLKGTSLKATSSKIDEISFDLSERNEKGNINIKDIGFEYDIKSISDYTTSFSLKSLNFEADGNKANINDINFSSSANQINEKVDLKSSVTLANGEIVEKKYSGVSQYKIKDAKISLNMNIDSKGYELLDDLDPTLNDRQMQKKLLEALDAVAKNEPKINLKLETQGVSVENINGKGSLEASLQMTKNLGIDDIQRKIRYNKKEALGLLNGSNIKIKLDNNAAKNVDPLLGRANVQMKSSGDMKELEISVKDGSIFANDKVVF